MGLAQFCKRAQCFQHKCGREEKRCDCQENWAHGTGPFSTNIPCSSGVRRVTFVGTTGKLVKWLPQIIVGGIHVHGVTGKLGWISRARRLPTFQSAEEEQYLLLPVFRCGSFHGLLPSRVQGGVLCHCLRILKPKAGCKAALPFCAIHANSQKFQQFCTGRRAKPGRFGSLAFAMKNRHFGGHCSWIIAGKVRKCGRFWVFACVPNPGKRSIWRQCPPSARKQSTKKLPNRPRFYPCTVLSSTEPEPTKTRKQKTTPTQTGLL